MIKFTFTEIEFLMIFSSIDLTINQLKKDEKNTENPEISKNIAQEIIRYKNLQNKLNTKNNAI